MISKHAGIFCDPASLLIAAAVSFSCMASPASVPDDVDASHGHLARAVIRSGRVIPRESFAYVHGPLYYLVADGTRLESLGRLAGPGNLHVVAESEGLTNHVNSGGTEIQRALW